jgi:hypothetical protein
LAGRWPPNAMPPRFDDYKRTLQFRLIVQRQDSFQFGMHGVLGRRQHAEIHDARRAALNKDQSTEIAVAGDERPCSWAT